MQHNLLLNSILLFTLKNANIGVDVRELCSTYKKSTQRSPLSLDKLLTEYLDTNNIIISHKLSRCFMSGETESQRRSVSHRLQRGDNLPVIC